MGVEKNEGHSQYGIGGATIGVAETVDYTATWAPDLSNGKMTKLMTLTGNITLNKATGGQSGETYMIVFQQDGTGSRTITLGTDMEYPPGTLTLSTAAGAKDYLIVTIDPFGDGKHHVMMVGGFS